MQIASSAFGGLAKTIIWVFQQAFFWANKKILLNKGLFYFVPIRLTEVLNIIYNTGMNDIVEIYLESLRLEKGSSLNSIEAYSRDIYRFVEHYKNKKITEISSLDITDYLITLQQAKLSSGTIARSLSVIKGFFKYAVQTVVININPANNIAGPKVFRPLPETLTIEQVIRILKMPDTKSMLGKRNKALLEFLYGTGARITEALNCRKDDLIPEMMLVRLFGKGKKERVVPLGMAGWRALH